MNRGHASILIVDDLPMNAELLSDILRAQGYSPRIALSGRWALQSAITHPPDLILLDIQMPEMDGYEVCERLKALEGVAKTPIIFLSAMNEMMDKVKAFSAGAVDYITKPFQVEEVSARVRAHLNLRFLQRELEYRNRHLEDLVKEQVSEIVSSHMATISALAKLAESRDDDTGNHIRRVQSYCKILACHLLEENTFHGQIDGAFIDTLFHAAPLHDIGKVGISDAILLKPDKLTESEVAIMQTHTLLGASTMESVLRIYPNNIFLQMGMEIARSHHERWDGSGYPDKLREEDIPLPARILTVADQYDALRSLRPYKPAFDHTRTRDIIVHGDGRTMPKHFDPRVLRAFEATADQFADTFHTLHDVAEVTRYAS